MKNKRNKVMLITIMMVLAIMGSCRKQNDWLDVKSNRAAVVPQTLDDFQSILDNSVIFNERNSTAGQVGSDNFSLNDAAYLAYDENTRNLYTWKKTIWENETSAEWNNQYAIIELANVVLDGLDKVSDAQANFNNVKGQALFHRAMAYYNLAQLFCKPYSSSATTDPGLPIRLKSDVNVISNRSTLTELYNQIILDAVGASTVLAKVQPYLHRPNVAASLALLAKVYLNMEDYDKAGEYANSALQLRPELLNYNSNTVVSPTSTYRFLEFGKNNPEILFYAQALVYPAVSPLTSSQALVADELYQSYSANDLRKTIFYAATGGTAKYRGAYSGNRRNFSGLATNELYFIRAECFARKGNLTSALADLNKLLLNRYLTGSFVPFVDTNQETVLKLILAERRKELAFVANLRWEDLRRLNKDVRFQKTLTRSVAGTSYSLSPNDNRYTLPIPLKEIQVSGIEQNVR